MEAVEPTYNLLLPLMTGPAFPGGLMGLLTLGFFTLTLGY